MRHAVGVKVPREVVVMECLVPKEGSTPLPICFPGLIGWREQILNTCPLLAALWFEEERFTYGYG